MTRSYDERPDLEGILAERWIEALQDAYRIALGDARARIRLTRIPTFNDQGLHPFSYMIGRVRELEALLGLGSELYASSWLIRTTAEKQALDEFRQEVRDGPNGRKTA